MGTTSDPIDAIDDTTLRRLVRTAVHVRRYLPFYVTGVFFAVTLAVVPAVGDGGSGTPASTAAPGGGAGSAAGVPAIAAAAAPSGRATGARNAGVADAPAFLDASFDAAVDAGAGERLTATTPGAGAADSRRGADPVAAPDFDADDDLPETPETPEACTVSPPSPAPQVDPGREVSGGQDTAEALAGASLPVDAADTAAPVTDEAACSVPEAPVEVPSVPLPATPVSTDPGLPFGWLLRLVGLF